MASASAIQACQDIVCLPQTPCQHKENSTMLGNQLASQQPPSAPAHAPLLLPTPRPLPHPETCVGCQQRGALRAAPGSDWCYHHRCHSCWCRLNHDKLGRHTDWGLHTGLRPHSSCRKGLRRHGLMLWLWRVLCPVLLRRHVPCVGCGSCRGACPSSSHSWC